MKVIFDTDPGLDDAIALFFMLGRSDKLEPLAITTVFGNVSIEKTTENALKLVESIKKEGISVHSGASHPLVRDLTTGEFIHGDSGLGDVELDKPKKQIEDTKAAVCMAEYVLKHPGEVTIITVGPMTNLGLAMRLFPEIKDNLKEVIVMGGSVGFGNRTASAEYNIFADPHAAHIVFESNVPITMIGLDVTKKSSPSKEHIEQLQEIDNKASSLALKFLDFYRKKFDKDKNIALHDACAVAYAIDPSIFTTKEMDVRVELTGTHTFGRTVCSKGQEEVVDESRKEKRPVNVALEIDREKFFKELIEGYRRL
ncbi:nucleoside hydrolase [Natranaerobius trueperi]|uniref:nucleoside hydrolase n=1 Tax=Natranaerobius trueperi TaxID=759412 RepID=UPI001303026A|nr:nucleoside hydrolase [Natranaerobius trueperi]